MKEIFIAILTICLFNACSSDSVEELKEELVCDTCEVNVEDEVEEDSICDTCDVNLEDEVDEDLCEGIDCDTNLISFQSDIYPIINTHCISCHGGLSPSAGLRLESHEQIRSSANNNTSSGMINRMERDISDLGLMPMYYKLSQDNIDLIKDWVSQGSLNN
ncbi:hypothetical protein N9V23_02300 [Flavobacteriales bacterium]|nr:hypothetical protein [Flavobacteriales bacterium]